MPAASSIYWDSVDSQRSSGGSSGDGASGSGRHYVDPWDLENYAYLRRHSIATPQQYDPMHNPRRRLQLQQQRQTPQRQTQQRQQQQQQRIVHRRRSHEQRPEPEVEYWYPPGEPIKEPGYHAPASVEELYFSGSRQQNTPGPYYQPLYDDNSAHYTAPCPIYAPISDVDHGRTLEDQRLEGMLKRRDKLGRAKGHERNREECFYHGTSSSVRRDSVDETIRARLIKGPEDGCYTEVVPPSSLGLNTYGHLKIDYTDSWNSLHRKIAK